MKTRRKKDDANSWEEEWKDMPEYDNKESTPPLITVTFKFVTEEDFDKFNEIIKASLFNGKKAFDGMQRKTVKSVWWPPKKNGTEYIYEDENESEISSLCD